MKAIKPSVRKTSTTFVNIIPQISGLQGQKLSIHQTHSHSYTSDTEVKSGMGEEPKPLQNQKADDFCPRQQDFTRVNKSQLNSGQNKRLKDLI